MDFLRYFIAGLVFWSLLVFAWFVQADELPSKPVGRTLDTSAGTEECFATVELKKIVAWVELAEHLHETNLDLLALNENYRAELTVWGQEGALCEERLNATDLEVDRLRELVALQQTDRRKITRGDKIRLALTWGAIGLLLGTTAAFAVAYGSQKGG